MDTKNGRDLNRKGEIQRGREGYKRKRRNTKGKGGIQRGREEEGMVRRERDKEERLEIQTMEGRVNKQEREE